MASKALFEEVDEYIDLRKDEFLEMLARFCRQPSISAQDIGIQDMANLVISEMGAEGIQARPLETGKNPAVYGETKGETDKALLFYNHYDVQPPEPYEAWVSPPFEPTVRDGRLYARGATDNKGNLVARVSAVKAVRAVRGSLPVTLKFLVDGEEEVGSPSLAQVVKENSQFLQANWILWEDTLREGETPIVSLGSKGLCYLELKCRTASTDFHSAFAGVYPNAGWRLVQALSTMKSPDGQILIDGFYDDVRPFTDEEKQLLVEQPVVDLDNIKKCFEIRRFERNVGPEGFRAQYVAEPTCNISGLISGYTGKGTKTVIPAEAIAKIDMRLVPRQTPEAIYRKVSEHLKRRGFDDIEVFFAWQGGRPSISRIDPFALDALTDSIADLYASPPIVEPLSSGATPMWVAIELLGCPVMSYGLGHPSHRTHAPNENVQIDEFINQVKIMARFLMRLGQ